MASDSDQEVFDVVENNKEETNNIDFEALRDDFKVYNDSHIRNDSLGIASNASELESHYSATEVKYTGNDEIK